MVFWRFFTWIAFVLAKTEMSRHPPFGGRHDHAPQEAVFYSAVWVVTERYLPPASGDCFQSLVGSYSIKPAICRSVY